MKIGSPGSDVSLRSSRRDEKWQMERRYTMGDKGGKKDKDKSKKQKKRKESQKEKKKQDKRDEQKKTTP
ncbi:MAG: hypothetical protein ABIE07_02705 [Candidatus Zixiibacteriota bacterium]